MSDWSDDDDAALARAARADRQAFLTLYDRYVGAVERYIAARTGSSQVDDLVSVTFTRALAGIHTFRPERGTFTAWLFTIARHAVADHYRQSVHSARLDDPAQLAAGALGPEALAVAEEERQCVRNALRELTPDQRDALALRYAAELPFAAVARALGKSEPAAKMLVQRGLQALRRQYEKDASHD